MQGYIADSWAQLQMFRLMVLQTAWKIDQYDDYRKVGKDIAACKAVMPQIYHDITQRALHLHGALGTWLLGPSAGVVLADWGAEVVKVEPVAVPHPARGLLVGGVEVAAFSPMAEFANRGKRSVALDVRHPKGRGLLHRLVATADVFITKLRPGATERLGVDVASLRAVNPDLICVRTSGSGQRGPDVDRPSFDVTSAWAAGGLAHQATRRDRNEPGFQRTSFGDITGGLTAAGAVAAALVKRTRTGESSVIDVALQSVGMWLMGYQVTMGAVGVLPPPHRHEGPPAPLVNALATKDGVWLYFAILQGDRYWKSFCRHVGRADLVDDPRFADATARREHTDELTALLKATFAEHSLAEWKDRLAGFDGAWAPALAPGELPDPPQVKANGFVVDVEYPDGVLPFVASPAQFDERPLDGVRRAPLHGEHTEQVLLELGLTMEEIIECKIEGAVL